MAKFDDENLKSLLEAASVGGDGINLAAMSPEAMQRHLLSGAAAHAIAALRSQDKGEG